MKRKTPDKSKKPSGRTAARKVRETEGLPPPQPPAAPAKPEADEDGWGEDGLTLKQRLFVQYFVGEAAGNATKAARLAGYRDDNYNALRVTACENLTKPNVALAIERLLAARHGSPEDARRGVVSIAFGTAAACLSPDPQTGKLTVDLDKLAACGALGLVSEIREEGFESGGEVTIVKRKLKLYDRLRALELLARMNGQLVERRDVTSNGETIKAYVNVSPSDWPGGAAPTQPTQPPERPGDAGEAGPAPVGLPCPPVADRPVAGHLPDPPVDG